MGDKDISLITEKRRMTLQGGGEIGCIITLPTSDELRGMSKFYSRIGEKCVNFCENGLASSLSDISHSYRYRLLSEIKLERNIIKVFIKVTLTDRSTARVIERVEMTHIWKYGLLIKAK